MKISMKWLNDWVDIGDVDPTDVADRLTMAGLEVDDIDYPGRGHSDIVVGEIAAIEEHPNADRLVVCRVDTGGDGLHTIVCGATNMDSGDRVPVALVGASPPGADFDIEAREVMGVESRGMLCSADELELDDDSEGLLILDAEAPLGEPVFEVLDATDVVIEFDLTPNRADCFSHLGVAREVAALYDRPLKEGRKDVEKLLAEVPDAKSGQIDLEIADEEGCPEYRLVVLEDIDVETSPMWLRRRLQAVGIRPVNSVVDVTNYVLMDVGQPLHAFDLDELAGPAIEVRRARSGETLVGIDHNEYELHEDDLVIADGEKPVALAGVMGGAETEVSESTTQIALECAWFDPSTVRRSSKRHGLHTDSSHRFERGVDPGGLDRAVERAVSNLVDVQRQGGGGLPGVTKEPMVAGRAPIIEDPIDVDPRRVAGLLGVELDAKACAAHLESIGVEVGAKDDGLLRCKTPSFRLDLRRPVDLVEEIARLHGYDDIPAELPEMVVGSDHRHREGKEATIVERTQRQRLDWVRSFLLDRGFREAINYSFIGADELDALNLADDDPRRRAQRVANPLVSSQELMRTSLVPQLLQNVKTNFSRRCFDVALFEIGRRYFDDGEVRTLALTATGSKSTHWQSADNWDFFDLKGLIEELALPWETENARWAVSDEPEPYLHPGVQAGWRIGDRTLGVLGQVHPRIAQREDFEEPVFVAELDLEALVAVGPRRPVAEPPPKYPAVVRDFALLYDDDRPWADLQRAVAELADAKREFDEMFEAMELFDVYEGEQVPEGKRSLAIKVTYRRHDRTLEEADVDSADRQLLSHLEAKVGAKLR